MNFIEMGPACVLSTGDGLVEARGRDIYKDVFNFEIRPKHITMLTSKFVPNTLEY